MQDLKDVYERLQQKKKERKELVKMFKDELAHDDAYQKIIEEMKVLKEKKKSIEDTAKASALSDARQLDDLADEIKGSTELLTDVVVAKFMNRESVELTDQFDNRLVPVFSVKFKKEEGENMAEQIHAERAASHPDRMFAPAGMVADTMAGDVEESGSGKGEEWEA
jgi:predicted nuclease with TOPRIM domain